MAFSRIAVAVAAVITIAGCTAQPNHPIDCAAGYAHADCLPGTLGYERLHNGNNISLAPPSNWRPYYNDPNMFNLPPPPQQLNCTPNGLGGFRCN